MTAASPPPGLRDDQLSALYLRADAVSTRGQRLTRSLVRLELVCLVVAGLAGVASWRVGAASLDVLAAVSGVAFVGALVCTGTRSRRRTEHDWYAGRAAAESVRTLAWRYAMGAQPFPVTDPEAVVRERFVARLAEIVRVTAVTRADAEEITTAMAEVRACDLPARRAVYLRDRIGDQLSWYRRRADSHQWASRLWLAVSVLAGALGVVAAVLKFVGVIDFDLLGVFAACSSAAVAWNQLNQHRNLVSAYTVTACELGIIADRVASVPDDEWAQFVSDCEDAISREHTLWLARHGQVGVPEHR